ncbi:MAG TPA: hypothetical protein VJ577_00245 [Burkholderiaceae bacterium]|nr:hypothetical protein [Burkholderiaceae bacterium]
MIEHSLRFGPKQALIGTFCLPEPSFDAFAKARTGIVFFNSGIVHRVGPHRINVNAARLLARQGIPSLRFDLSGLGDSGRISDGRSFEEQAVADLRAAMTALGEAAGVDRFGLFGFCSGAYHGYHAAQVDARVAGLLLFDAYRYPTVRAHLNRLSLRFRQYGIARNTARIGIKLLHQLAARLRDGHSKTPVSRAPSAGFIVDHTSKQDFAAGIARLLDRGVSVAMAFAGDGFEVYNYPRQFHDAFRRLGIADRVDTSFFPDLDHVVTGVAAQQTLVDHVARWARQLAAVGQDARGSRSAVSDFAMERGARTAGPERAEPAHWNGALPGAGSGAPAEAWRASSAR